MIARLFCQCGTPLRYRKSDYEHADWTTTCASVRPIRTEIS